MGITIEQLKQWDTLGIKKHLEIVDGYIASGLELDDLTIHYGVEQDRCAAILHGYRFGVGSAFEDDFDSIKKYKGIPFRWIEQYVSAYYPGLTDENPEDAWINLESYLDIYQPNWKVVLGSSKHSMFRLSKQELEDNSSNE